MTRRSLRLRDKPTEDSETQTLSSEIQILSTEDCKHPRNEEQAVEEESNGRVRKKARNSTSDEGEQTKSSSAVSKRKKMPQEFKKVRGKFGLLEKLAKDAPLDIFFEVSMHFQGFCSGSTPVFSLDFHTP